MANFPVHHEPHDGYLYVHVANHLMNWPELDTSENNSENWFKTTDWSMIWRIGIIASMISVLWKLCNLFQLRPLFNVLKAKSCNTSIFGTVRNLIKWERRKEILSYACNLSCKFDESMIPVWNTPSTKIVVISVSKGTFLSSHPVAVDIFIYTG